MAITRVGAKTRIKAGQWINALTPITAMLCGRPMLVTRDVTNNRVYYRRPGWESDEPDKYLMLESVVFLCDTRDEATAMFELSEQRLNEINRAVDVVESKFDLLIKDKLGKKRKSEDEEIPQETGLKAVAD